MLTAYIEAAMSHATYRFLEPDGIFFGEIPGLRGVWGSGETQEACRADLREALEDWVIFQLRRNNPIPAVDGISLEPATA